jgi:hypothetical protein
MQMTDYGVLEALEALSRVISLLAHIPTHESVTMSPMRRLCDYMQQFHAGDEWDWYVHRHWLMAQVRYRIAHGQFDKQLLLVRSIPRCTDMIVTIFGRVASNGANGSAAKTERIARMACLWMGSVVTFAHSAHPSPCRVCCVEVRMRSAPHTRVVSMRCNGVWAGVDLVMRPGSEISAFRSSVCDHLMNSGAIKLEFSCHLEDQQAESRTTHGDAERGASWVRCAYPPLFVIDYSVDMTPTSASSAPGPSMVTQIQLAQTGTCRPHQVRRARP